MTAKAIHSVVKHTRRFICTHVSFSSGSVVLQSLNLLCLHHQLAGAYSGDAVLLHPSELPKASGSLVAK